MGGKVEELDIIKAVHEVRDQVRKEEAEKREQLEKEIEQLKKENAELKAAVYG